MAQPLFLRHTIDFEKVAYTAHLDGDIESWPTGIIEQAYKELPFLERYQLDITVDKGESSRGFAVGKLLVFPLETAKEKAAEDGRIASIPVIVKDSELSPLDVFMHKDIAYPMDEAKFGEIMSNPRVFLGPSAEGQFSGTSLVGQLQPPAAGQTYLGQNMHKFAGASLLKVASATFREEHLDEVKGLLRNDAPLRHAYLTNPGLSDALALILDCKEKTAAEKADARRACTKPTAIQFRAEGTGFIVKTANHNIFKPEEQRISRFEAQRVLSKEAFDKLQQDGLLTMSVEPTHEPVVLNHVEVGNRPGMYRVWSDGREVEGVLVPRMMTLQGEPYDMTIFSSPEGHAYQEKVAGVFVDEVSLPDTEPSGRGVFVYQTGHQAIATEPVVVQHVVKQAMDGEEQKKYIVKQAATGAVFTLYRLNGLQKVASMGGNEIALPRNFRFLPLRGEQLTVPADAPDADFFEQQKVAGPHVVEVISDGYDFSIRGPNTNGIFKEAMDRADAEFALAALGVTGKHARAFLKEASQSGCVNIPNTRPVVSEEKAKVTEMAKVASYVRSFPDLRVNLIKEAAVIKEKETADAILSLNFVTPENAQIYVQYLPELEKVASRLAELLVASRLGMDEVKESAVKIAMTQLNSVIHGLKHLRAKVE